MRWFKEPLLHFLLIGAAIFLLFYQVGDSGIERQDQIVISADDIRQLSALWEKRWQRPPTSTELDGLIRAHVREEVLYREALALGLEQNDTIVRRRMAQKMEFLFQDITEAAPPTDAELEAYLQANPERFQESARFSFMHVYLSTDQGATQAGERAQMLLNELRLQGDKADPVSISDLFMFGNYFDNRNEAEVARMLGPDFARALNGLPTNQWQGPVQSAYGLHLIYIHERSTPRLPPLAEIRDRVLTELQYERQELANEAMFEALQSRYEIIIERPDNAQIADIGVSRQ
ncbi:MAG: peptidylprolyl isomerase [Gammaproteobacteria bacterium]|nr:peptidylprolyl isomerase [Gammaproteobacteria bacterium]